MSKFNLNLFILAFLVMTTVSGYAQDAAPTVEGTAMSQEEMAMQKRMMEYSTVNENHALLNSLAGSWNTHASFWMDPKGPAQESDGTSQNAIIMGGRFLEQKFSGSMMGQPFEGRGIFGYDNFRKEYTGIWFDNFATGMMVSASQYNTTTKTFIEEGTMSCPISEEAHRWFRAVTTVVDDNHYTYESYMKDKDGQEFKAMRIEYTRAQ